MAVEKVGQDEKVKKKCTCKNCSSILLYLPPDVLQGTCSHQGDTEAYWYIICPDCKQRVEVKRP